MTNVTILLLSHHQALGACAFHRFTHSVNCRTWPFLLSPVVARARLPASFITIRCQCIAQNKSWYKPLETPLLIFRNSCRTMPLDRDDGAPAAAPPPELPSEFEQKVTKFLMREVPDSCLIKGVVCNRACLELQTFHSSHSLHRFRLSWAGAWGFCLAAS